MRIISVGEIIFDVFGDEAEIGGAPLNFCAHCALLGAESALVSAVGNDKLGERALKELENFGVSTSFIQKKHTPTGICEVTLADGVPSYNVIFDAAYFETEINETVIDSIKKFNPDIFAFGTLIQRSPCVRNGIERILEECSFGEIFCDINLRSDCYCRKSCLNCLENATILKISREEEPLLNEFGFYEKGGCERDTVRNICTAFDNIRIVLFTKGEDGSFIYDKETDLFYDIPCVHAEVVSTVGAGDSYSAAFLCEYFKSGDIEKSGTSGAKLSASVVSHREAVRKGEK